MFLLALPLLLVAACAPKTTVQTGEQIARDLALPPYDGPPAHIAVGPCENRTGGAGTFTVGDTRISLDNEIGRGMGDMLVSALVNTGRFAVVEANPEVVAALERQRAIRGEAEAGPGLASADLMVTCGVTEFEPDASGIGGGAANIFGRTLAGAIAGTSTSRVGIDIRLVDVSTGLVLSAFTVRGEARNVTMGGLAARRFGPARSARRLREHAGRRSRTHRTPGGGEGDRTENARGVLRCRNGSSGWRRWLRGAGRRFWASWPKAAVPW